jgi:restriction endonuclease S subunit
MQKKLIEIASISTGQTFRKKVENNPAGDVSVIQMKDFNDSYTAISATPNKVSINDVSENQLLHKKDILFLAKGNHNPAFLFDRDDVAVVVSLFFVIRVKSEDVLPSYLAWFLNNQNTQNLLQSAREGISVSNIKKSFMEELEVEIPSLEKQHLIGEVYQLSIEENKLLSELLAEKQKLVMSGLINTIKNGI